MAPENFKKPTKGFTLTELLISLLISGEIATFTIPKVLNAQQISSNNAKAKELAGMVSDAYLQYRMQNTVTSSVSIANLTPYMNYVKADTSTVIDNPSLRQYHSV